MVESKIDGSKYKQKRTKYSGKFVKENFSEHFTVEQGAKFKKSWTFRNDGQMSWPKDTRLLLANGADFGMKEQEITQEVKPGMHIDVTVEFTAPQNIGRQTAFFRLAYGQGEKLKRFGQKVWCDIDVVKADDDIARLQREMGQFN